MRPLKIALVASSYWEENDHHDGDEGGGIQQLAEGVAALGHEVVVLSHSPKVAKLKKAQVGALETWLMPADRPRSFLTGLRDRWVRRAYGQQWLHSDATHLREVLYRRRPFDVIWAHRESPDGVAVAMAAQQGAKLPPVLVQVQGLRQRFEKGDPVFIDRLALGAAFRKATRLLAVSELVASSLHHYAGPGLTAAELQEKVHVVYPNLQRAFLRTAAEDSPLPAAMADRVLFLGELNQARGALLFLNSVAKTAAAQRNAVFIVMGDFTEKNARFFKRWEEAKEATRVALSGARIEYIGRVSTFEVIRQIKLARVVVVPALFNAFSRGLVEALVLGRAVIASSRVGAAPLVQAHECGIVVPPHDSGTLAEAIDIALGGTDSFTENARNLSHRLMHEFAPEAIARQVAHHLSEIAGPAK